jgi:hypothetical protein
MVELSRCRWTIERFGTCSTARRASPDELIGRTVSLDGDLVAFLD